MCLIIYKPKGIKISKSVLVNAWNRNSDGAGIMFIRGKKVGIIKGIMTVDRLRKAINSMGDDECAVHFRLRSNGKLSAGMTHPFPIVADARKLVELELNCHRAIMHNGVISGFGHDLNGLSDTAEFSQLLSRHSDSEIESLCRAVGDRFVLALSGRFIRIGMTEDKALGIEVSNQSYKPPIVFPATETYTGKSAYGYYHNDHNDIPLWTKDDDRSCMMDNLNF